MAVHERSTVDQLPFGYVFGCLGQSVFDFFVKNETNDVMAESKSSSRNRGMTVRQCF